MLQVRQSSAVVHFLFLMVDSTDHVTGKTGLSPTVTISKNAAAFASPSGAITEVSGGWYKLAANATDSNTLGVLALHATGTAADPTDMILCNIVAIDVQDAVREGLTALPNAAAEAAGGLYTRGTGAGQIKQTNNGEVDANATRLAGTANTGRDIGASVLLSSGTGTGQLDFTSGVVKANLAQILGTALTETAGLLAGGFKKFFNVASPTGTLNSIPDAVPDASGGLPVTGNRLTAIPTVAAVTTVTNLTNAPTAGDLTATMKTSVTTAATAATPTAAAVTGNVGGNVTGSVGSIATGGIAAASFAAGALDAVWSVATRLLTAGTNIVLAKGTGVTGFNDLSAAAVNTEVDTGISDYFGVAGASLTSIPDSAGTTTLLSRLTATRAGYLDNLSAGAVATLAKLTKYVQLLARKDAAIATDNAAEVTAINADGGSGGGAYANTTDSQEALRDRGDAAWVTGSTPLDAAATRAAVGLASANLDTQLDALPTNAELAAGFAAADDATLAAIAALPVPLTAAGTRSAVGLASANLDTQLDALPTAAENADAVWDEAKSDHTTPDTFGDYLDDEITSRMATFTYTAPLDAAGTRSSVGLATANLDTQLGNIPTNAELAAEIDAVQADIAALPTPPSAASIADGVWDEAIGGHLGAGSTGEALSNAGAGGTPPTVQAIVDGVWDEAIADHQDVGSTGEALSDAGGAGTPPTVVEIRQEMDTNSTKLARLDVTLSTRATQTSVDDLPTNAELATALAAADDAVLLAIGALNNLSTAQVLTQVTSGLNSYDAPTKAEMDAGLALLATAANLATVAGNVVGIKAKTDALPADPADASDIAASFAAVDADLTTILAAIPTAIENADALLGRDFAAVAGAADRSVIMALRMLRNRTAVVAGVLRVYLENDTTVAWQGAVTQTAGNPITEIDPA